MTGTSGWLPTWLGVVATVVFAAVLVVHLRHVGSARGWWRTWHLGHVLMALAMLGMYLPVPALAVPRAVGQYVFLLAFLFAVCTLRLRQPPGLRWLWAVSAADFVVMVYMYVMESPAYAYPFLTLVMVVWLAGQILGWALGALGGGLGLGRRGIGDGGRGRHDTSVRVTLVVMNVGMASMLLAMQYGMTPGAMAGMPGM